VEIVASESSALIPWQQAFFYMEHFELVAAFSAHHWQFFSEPPYAVPYLTLPPGWAGSYTCPALRLYHFGPMRIPECNHKVTGSGYKAVDGYEVINRRL